jgi:hypothetical protein
VIPDDDVQDLGQVEHGVAVPGVDGFLIRGTCALRRVPVQEVTQIDQRLGVAGLGLPPVETVITSTAAAARAGSASWV